MEWSNLIIIIWRCFFMDFFIEETLDEYGNWSVVLVDSELNIIEEVALFLHYLETKSLSINTLESYCRVLKEYYTWLDKENLKFYEVTKRNTISFIAYIHDSVGNKKRKSPRTVNKYLAALSSFYTYYEGIGGFIEGNPITIEQDPNHISSFFAHKPKMDTKRNNFFRQKENKKKNNQRLFPKQVTELYNAIDSLTENQEVSIRNKLIFKMLYETGMRIGECLGTRILDYSEPNPSERVGIIYVREYPELYHKDHRIKTNVRDIPVSMDLIFAIDHYVCNVRPQTKTFDTIFVNHRGGSLGLFMKRDSITKFFSQLSDKTGIKCTAHTLRHTHGTELAESGYQEEYIRNRLGHNSSESTSKYMHLSLESQITAYEKFISVRQGGDSQNG